MSAQRSCSYRDPRAHGRRLDYLLFLPDGYGDPPSRRWPVILFLHGAGERGADLELLKRQGIPRLIEEQPAFPFVTVSPQCPPRSAWHLHLTALEGLLDEVMAAHAVDPERVYLTGISMGGYGAWHLAAARPHRFAALVPICGGGLFSQGFPERVCRLKAVPVWAFHGARDKVVPLEESARMVAALRACGGKVRFTVYPDAEHDAWTRTYADPAVFEWLLAQARPSQCRTSGTG